MKRGRRDESIAYHAARLLLIIGHVGSPQRNFAKLPGVRGRTLLAKADFFVRYPTYLERAALIRSQQLRRPVSLPAAGPEGASVESHMVRYLYGPWDDDYFNILAYLIGKRLIIIEMERGVETFRLTARGSEAVSRLADSPDFRLFAARAEAVAAVFPNFRGTALKEFIYQHFPEIASRKVGTII